MLTGLLLLLAVIIVVVTGEAVREQCRRMLSRPALPPTADSRSTITASARSEVAA